MVKVSQQGDSFIFEPQGWHRLWTFRSRIAVPAASVVHAGRTDENVSWIWGLRLLGTHVPGIIAAGTYRVDGRTVFYDVTDRRRAVAVELRNHFFDRMVIEVSDPDAVIALLNSGRGG